MIRVAVVDDSKFMAKQIRSLVEEMGFEVVGVGHDGIQGLALFEEHRPDVTLLDITMPNMDGVECLQKIREQDPQAGVVILSAIKEPGTVEECMQKGASGFVSKPIRPGSPEDLSRLSFAIENAATQKVS